jgi:phenylpropionate dioxygenase-like ring-hydroxylating dioxygenase large terminal subunit
MPGLMNDQEVAARVLGHVRDGTTDRSNEVWREPVANYRSEARLHREIATVLRKTPTPFCPSAALPEKGSYVAREAAGTPLLVVRGDDGRVRAFRNACRHRGTPLADGSGCATVFVCPYHAWTYRLDGSLKSIPHADGFPTLDMNSHGLVPVQADEQLGLVFVTQDAASTALRDKSSAPWSGMPELFSPGQALISARSGEVDVNWKVYLEGFLEGYHIKPAHPKSFYPYGYDNLNVIERCGRNSRITFPFRRIEKLADVPPADRRVDGLLTYVYHLFPNVLVTVLSHHTNIVVLEPLSIDRTRVVLYALANLGSGTSMEDAKRDATFVNDTGGAEDLALVLAIQRSIGSGANEVFTFGEFEGLVTHFHRNMREALGEMG